MDALFCVRTLLDSSKSIEDKLDTFAGYLDWHDALAKNMRVGVRFGREVAITQLFKALEGKSPDEGEKLRTAMDEIYQYSAGLKKKRVAETKIQASQLRSLSPGTCIAIRNMGREKVVRLIEMNRTRFICEFSNGLRYRVPVSAFIRVHDGIIPECNNQEETQCRGLVLMLPGRNHKLAMRELVAGGVKGVRILLEELDAALDRVEHAPTGLSNGVFSTTVGLIKKVNPRDVCLTKRIPAVIAEIAAMTDANQVRAEIKQYPGAKARDRCIVLLGKSR